MISDMVSYVFAFCGAQVTSHMTWGQDSLFKLTCKFIFSKYKLYIKWTKVELFRLLHHRTRKVPQILLPNPNVHSEQRADESPSSQAWGHVLCRLSTCLSPLVVPSPARGRTLSLTSLWAFPGMLDSRESVWLSPTPWGSDGTFVFTSGRKQEEYFVDNRCDWGTVDDTFTSVSWVSPGSILLSMNR